MIQRRSNREDRSYYLLFTIWRAPSQPWMEVLVQHWATRARPSYLCCVRKAGSASVVEKTTHVSLFKAGSISHSAVYINGSTVPKRYVYIVHCGAWTQTPFALVKTSGVRWRSTLFARMFEAVESAPIVTHSAAAAVVLLLM